MSNNSIFGKNWLDLVFEGKNQKYGAYQLRRDSSKTTLMAFFVSVTFIALVSGTGLLLSSFGSKPMPKPLVTINDSIVVTPYVARPVEKKKEAVVKPKVKTPEVKIPVIKIENRNFKVAPTEESKTPITSNVEVPIINAPGIITDGPGTKGTPTPINTGGTTTGTEPIKNNGPVNAKELDTQPAFPGGMKNFYQYVGNNFDKDNLEEGETIRVKVSFVIEKNGAMTDIEVLEKTNETVDKEAVRVLKSLKTKWTPGIKDGAPVRTRYTLPITVVL
ncbi:energy transducer TonB [Flavobacterium sp.]|uniref:energy transducer TonB n=1 Tax=Flavobacterium sp. TaxID=239 RepID=UPI003753AA07